MSYYARSLATATTLDYSGLWFLEENRKPIPCNVWMRWLYDGLMSSSTFPSIQLNFIFFWIVLSDVFLNVSTTATSMWFLIWQAQDWLLDIGRMHLLSSFYQLLTFFRFLQHDFLGSLDSAFEERLALQDKAICKCFVYRCLGAENIFKIVLELNLKCVWYFALGLSNRQLKIQHLPRSLDFDACTLSVNALNQNMAVYFHFSLPQKWWSLNCGLTWQPSRNKYRRKCKCI